MIDSTSGGSTTSDTMNNQQSPNADQQDSISKEEGSTPVVGSEGDVEAEKPVKNGLQQPEGDLKKNSQMEGSGKGKKQPWENAAAAPKTESPPSDGNWPTLAESKKSPEPAGSNRKNGAVTSDKKKGTNWVPLKEALPQNSYARSSRGRGNNRNGNQRDGANRFPRNNGNNNNNKNRNQQGRGRGYNRQNQNQNQPQNPNQQPHQNSNHNLNQHNQNHNHNQNPNQQHQNQNPNQVPIQNPANPNHNQQHQALHVGDEQLFASPAVSPNTFYPQVESEQMKEIVLQQVEYYFSFDNLIRDYFLKLQMDEEGYVPVSVIGNFNRVKVLVSDIDQLVDTLQESKILEVNEPKDRIRLQNGWEDWIIPKESKQNGIDQKVKTNDTKVEEIDTKRKSDPLE